MVTVYKIKDGIPVAVGCETPGFPNRDAEDETMYDNTHFSTIEEAWSHTLRATQAAQKEAVESVLYHREQLKILEARLVEAAISRQNIHDKWIEWVRSNVINDESES